MVMQSGEFPAPQLPHFTSSCRIWVGQHTVADVIKMHPMLAEDETEAQEHSRWPGLRGAFDLDKECPGRGEGSKVEPACLIGGLEEPQDKGTRTKPRRKRWHDTEVLRDTVCFAGAARAMNCESIPGRGPGPRNCVEG